MYARFRVSIDNGFRNEFSYIDYRRWGVVELWAAGRIKGPPPKRQRAEDRIEVWFNWAMVGEYTNYRAARAKVDELLSSAPVDLREFVHYLDVA